MRQVQRWAEVQFQNTNKLGFIIKLSSCYIKNLGYLKPLFQKSEINTWNFGMYDIPSERQEFNLYGSIKIV